MKESGGGVGDMMKEKEIGVFDELRVGNSEGNDVRSVGVRVVVRV